MRAALLLVVVGACAAPTPESRPTVTPSPHGALTLSFEPPLLAPGELFVSDESGAEHRFVTGCTGVTVEVAPGPLALRLCADGREWTCVLRTSLPAEHVWRLGGAR
ncbi:MAG: hypothetical protein R3F29_04495 [Planctomycetota bacterium]